LAHVADVGLGLTPGLGEVAAEDQLAGREREALDLLDGRVRGTARARGSVTKSMSAGPGWANARSMAGRMSAAFSTRSPCRPIRVATAPKSGFFTSVPHGW
jgi:hypothetical protein